MGLGISSILRGFDLVREVGIDLPEEVTFASTSEGCEDGKAEYPSS